MLADDFRRAVMAAPCEALPGLSSSLWKAFGAGGLSEEEAEELVGLISARQTVALAAPPRPVLAHAADRVAAAAVARARTGSRARSAESLSRRRRWAAAGFLPPALACTFTQGEVAALAVVAQEAVARGRCAMPIGQVAALAGVSPSTVKRAIRQARALGLLAVEERRLARTRNDTNLVRVVSAEWLAWLRLRVRPSVHPRARQGGGVQTSTGTSRSLAYRDCGDNRTAADGPERRSTDRVPLPRRGGRVVAA
jgi:hypothetical protein